MKRQFLIAIITAGILIAGCNKDNEDDNGGDTPQNVQVSCNVNGSQWSTTTGVGAFWSGTDLMIAGGDVNGKLIQISISDFAGTGTYQIAGNPTNINLAKWVAGTGQDQTFIAQYDNGYGTIDITSVSSDKIGGTFSFVAPKAKQEMTITNGVFYSTLVEQ